MKALITLVAAAVLFAASDPTGDAEFRHPLLKGHGGIVALPDAAEPPRKGSKVLLDVTPDGRKGGVLKGLDRAAVIANLYEQAGGGPSSGMKLAVVIHGPATKAVLTDEAYTRHVTEAQNPDLELIRQLRQAGWISTSVDRHWPDRSFGRMKSPPM